MKICSLFGLLTAFYTDMLSAQGILPRQPHHLPWAFGLPLGLGFLQSLKPAASLRQYFVASHPEELEQEEVLAAVFVLVYCL